MGLCDALKEDRVEVKFSTFYEMMRESAKCELLLNAVEANVPNEHICKMAGISPLSGKGEKCIREDIEDETNN